MAAPSVESESGVLTDLSEEALAAAIETNTVEYWRTCCTYVPGAKFYDGLEMTWFVTGIAHAPWFNQVLLTRLTPEQVDARIDERLALYRERGLPMLWSVSSSVRPADLGAYLEAHGLTLSGALAGMAVDLQALRDETSTPPGFTIERAGDVETLKKWAHAYINGFEMPEFAGRALFDVYARVGFDDRLPFRHYVGILDGEAVASSTLFLGAGVAGVWHVGTVPAARQQGIGRAMSLAPLSDAGALGYRVGTLYASDMGLSVYRRLGFEEYCALVQYRWAPEA